MGRIIILDDDHGESIPEMNIFFQGTRFIYAREVEIKSNLCSSIRELHFSLKNYRNTYNNLIHTRTNPELDHYLDEINSTDSENFNPEIELENTKLSYYFKTYLVFVKSVLDKTIPFIHHRYKFSGKIFEARGKQLLQFLRKKYTGPNKLELIKLLESNKEEWLDEVLLLRDEFVHNSSLRQYRDFNILLDKNKVVKDLLDFNPPSIEFGGKTIHALEFLRDTHSKLLTFLNTLLIKFGFDEYIAPDFSTECPRCKFLYAEIRNYENGRQLIFHKPTPIHIFNKEYEHGIVQCPSCEKEVEVSLTILKGFGLNIETGEWKR